MEYKFKINEFEGPLDLLLHLIKQSEMDIMDIEIVKLTDQYLEYINNMEKFNLNVASEYLVLASTLTYLKSKALLPKKETEEEEDDEYNETKEDLINRLLEYKRYKEVTNAFKVLEDARSNIYSKTPSNIKEYKGENITLSDDITVEDLVNAFKKKGILNVKILLLFYEKYNNWDFLIQKFKNVTPQIEGVALCIEYLLKKN